MIKINKKELAMSENIKEKLTAQDYLQDCFMQKIQNEIDAYNKNDETVLDKYSKLSIKYLPYIGLCLSSSLILLYSSLSLNAISQLIGLFALIFVVAVFLVIRFYLKNKDDKELKLDIYDSWKKTILGAILVNFGLYIFSSDPHTEMLIILSIATIALIIIQKGVKRSL